MCRGTHRREIVQFAYGGGPARPQYQHGHAWRRFFAPQAVAKRRRLWAPGLGTQQRVTVDRVACPTDLATRPVVWYPVWRHAR